MEQSLLSFSPSDKWVILQVLILHHNELFYSPIGWYCGNGEELDKMCSSKLI